MGPCMRGRVETVGRRSSLLHGLVFTGDVFGEAFDDLANEGRVVVPDLLGFGRSLDANRDSFTADDQLDALDRLAEHLGLFDCRWVIGAHSMGSPLAVRWAARHEERVERVVGWGAPMYESPEAATAGLAGDLMGELFALDTRWAEAACAVSCRHRTLAGWITAAAKPTLPVPISRAVSHHTWPACRDSVQYLVMDVEWHALLAAPDRAGTPVELVWGANDVIGDVEYARTVIDQGEHSRVTLVPEVDHYLPLTNPAICLSQLLNRPQSTGDEISRRRPS